MALCAQWDEWVDDIFAEFDVSNTGVLSIQDVREVLCGDVCLAADDPRSAIREVSSQRRRSTLGHKGSEATKKR